MVQKKFIILLVVVLGLIGVILLSHTIRQQQTISSRAMNGNVVESDEEGMISADEALVDGFPAFPVYPKAEIEKSSRRVTPLNTGGDLHAVWECDDSVASVMKWYVKNLEEEGWTVQATDDPESEGEQIAQIAKGIFKGYLGIEIEGNETEIVVDLNNSQQ